VNAERPEIMVAFRKQGLRCTAQRYAIMKYLLKHPLHPTADDIYQALNRVNPQASRATVYNGLHALTRAGLVREVSVSGHAARFESHVEHHHHFVCERCGRIRDLDWFDVPGVSQKAGLNSRAVRAWELVFHGLCEDCLNQKRRN
jgi:Fur family peroxide stress response transcriptional regulator